MKAGDVRAMGDEQLKLAERNTTEELWKLRFQHHTGQLQNTAGLRETRKKLARIKTVLNERQRGMEGN
ncbi:MAG: 50S ribosomal protein L29 [Myxococcales bacterium]|jgi:large subunit ribosomal protein L29|nr:50S ribosomal protein L29 [Myxococcales bacterium]